jgi:hypothetical protein
MKKEYIEPIIDMLHLDDMQALMGVSDLVADPGKQTGEMDAKEAGDGWFNEDEEDKVW